MLLPKANASPDWTQTCVISIGGKVSRDAGPVKGGKTVIAFVEDPTGYKWELITREEPIKEPIAQVSSLPLSLLHCHEAPLR